MNNERATWSEQRTPFALILLFVFSASIRLASAHWDPLWTDEAVTIDFARASQDGLLLRLLYDASPPGSYMFFKFWLEIFEHPVFVRYLSALAGALTVLGTFYLGRRLFNEKIALFSAALLAINPYHFYYSQEIRYPALLTLFVVLQIWAFIRLIDREDWSSGIIYALLTALCLWIQYFVIFIIFAQVFWLILFKRKAKRLLLQVTSTLLVSGLLFLPIASILWLQLIAGKSDRLFVSFGESLLLSLLFPVLGGSEFGLPSLPFFGGIGPKKGGLLYLITGLTICLPFFVFAIFGVLVETKSGKKRLLGTFLAFCPLVLFLIFSQFIPIFRPKYILPLAPMFLCLVAAGVMSGNISFVLFRKVIGFPLLIIFFTWGLYNQHYDPLCRRELWNVAEKRIRMMEKKGDAVLIPNRYHSLGFDFAYGGNLPVYSFAGDAPTVLPFSGQLMQNRMVRLERKYNRFWIIGHKEKMFDPHGSLEKYARKNWILLKDFKPEHINHDIPVRLFATNKKVASDSYLSNIDFSNEKFISAQLNKGFFEKIPEGYRWMDKVAGVTVRNEGCLDMAYACIYLHRPFFKEYDPTVRLLVNGFSVASRKIRKSNMHCLEGIIPENMKNKSMVDLEIDFDRAFQPYQIYGGNDRREKSALVQKIGLTYSSQMLEKRCALP